MTRTLGAFYVACCFIAIAWDTVLHGVGMYYRDPLMTCSGKWPDLPWYLWPQFSSWFAYDAFWMGVHGAAAIALFVFAVQLERSLSNVDLRK